MSIEMSKRQERMSKLLGCYDKIRAKLAREQAKTLRSHVVGLFDRLSQDPNLSKDRSLEARAYADVLSTQLNKRIRFTSVERYVRELRAIQNWQNEQVDGNTQSSTGIPNQIK